MTKTYYHATPYANLNSVMKKGIRRGFDGCIYLTEKPEESVRFLAIRGIRDIAVFGVDLEEGLVTESFDHSETFFQCKAYMYDEDISLYEISSASRYQLGG